MVSYALTGLSVLIFIAHLVYFVLVIVQMFKRNQTALGIVSIVLAPCAGIGLLIAFIMGWVKSGEWGIKNMMWQWTGVLVAGILVGCCNGAITSMAVGTNVNKTFTTVGGSISWPK
jgi:hypothetical protein